MDREQKVREAVASALECGVGCDTDIRHERGVEHVMWLVPKGPSVGMNVVCTFPEALAVTGLIADRSQSPCLVNETRLAHSVITRLSRGVNPVAVTWMAWFG